MTILALGCASVAPPSPGTALIHGSVRLVPNEGVTPGHAGGAYGDRALRDVRFVDYTRPGFSVVYAEQPPPSGDRAEIQILDGRRGPVFDPSQLAVAKGGSIVIRNDSARPQSVSIPASGQLRSLEPGVVLELSAEEAGEQRLFLLGDSRREALVFVAPGPYATAAADGSYELRDLAPGAIVIRAWHPRFPSASRLVDAETGQIVEIDFAVGVHSLEETGHAGH